MANMKTNHSSSRVLSLLLAGLILSNLAIRAASPLVSGELKQWHKVTLTLDGPQAKETDTDPTWQTGKGKGIIGALNYLADKGANAVSFLTMNIVGDDQNVFP